MTLRLQCNSRGVIDHLWPHINQALEDELLTLQEAADLLTDAVVGLIEIVEGLE